MEKEITKQKEQEVDNTDSFLSKVMEFFIKLMDKYTKGKYSTPEEQEFFSDEKNLYNEDGTFTKEYQRRIDELEEHVRHNSIDDFLVEVHSKDSEELGPAYSETEMKILKSGLEFITEQQKLVRDILEAYKVANRKEIPFSFDDYLKKKVEQDGGDYETAKENIKQYVIEHINEIREECPEFVDFLGITIDNVNSNKE